MNKGIESSSAWFEISDFGFRGLTNQLNFGHILDQGGQINAT